MKRILILLLLLALLLISSACAITLEEKYDTEFNKLKLSSSYVTLNDKGEIEYSIHNFNPSYEYYVRVYSYRHTGILKEYLVREPSGVIPFEYPGLHFTIHINLQKVIPEGKEREYCIVYPCKIGENLDIFTTNIIEKVPSSDYYTFLLRTWTRNDPITGASWQSMINVDKEEI